MFCFPRVEAFDQGLFLRRPRRLPPEHVGVFQILEELEGVVDAIDAEGDVGDVGGGEGDGRLFTGREGLAAVEREVDTLLLLAHYRRRQR